MSRALRLVAVAALLAGVLQAARLALPGAAFACMCVAPLPGIETYDEPEQAVLMGRVLDDRGSGLFPMAVERWFHGGTEANVVLESGTIRDANGAFSSNSCGVDLEAGSQLILGAQRNTGRYVPSACSPMAEVASPEGQAMLRAATQRFGPGHAPGELIPPSTVVGPLVGIDLSTIAIGGVVIIIVLIAVAAVVAVGRRGSKAEGAS